MHASQSSTPGFDIQSYSGWMDSDILSAENYYDGVFGGRASIEGQGNDSQWLGGLLANRTITQSPVKKNGLDGMRTRQPSRKDSTKSTGADDSSGVRQRGRPRLDTRDHTAAEVCLLTRKVYFFFFFGELIRL